jgi:hypothetical protein
MESSLSSSQIPDLPGALHHFTRSVERNPMPAVIHQNLPASGRQPHQQRLRPQIPARTHFTRTLRPSLAFPQQSPIRVRPVAQINNLVPLSPGETRRLRFPIQAEPQNPQPVRDRQQRFPLAELGGRILRQLKPHSLIGMRCIDEHHTGGFTRISPREHANRKAPAEAPTRTWTLVRGSGPGSRSYEQTLAKPETPCCTGAHPAETPVCGASRMTVGVPCPVQNKCIRWPSTGTSMPWSGNLPCA